MLPRLVRNGVLDTVTTDQFPTLPNWMQPIAVKSQTEYHKRRLADLFVILEESLAKEADFRWDDWKTIAYTWAELSSLQADGYHLPSKSDNKKLTRRLDEAFFVWLQKHYTALATQCLPIPHHLYRVPHYMNYRRENGTEKQALLILDGMSLSDWLLIKKTWQNRQSWNIYESLLLAQIPTITSVSRQALVSGLRPADFASTIQTNRQEACQWAAFWNRVGIQPDSHAYVAAHFHKAGNIPELSDPRINIFCLVERTVDEMVHNSLLGKADLVSSLKIWLDQYSQQLEHIIANLLERGFHVFLTSDHGHADSLGIGTPNEGVLAQTRGKRVRIYTDKKLAAKTLSDYPLATLWENDGLLPDDLYAILPKERAAFAQVDEQVLTHGGATIDEVIIPFVEIKHG